MSGKGYFNPALHGNCFPWVLISSLVEVLKKNRPDMLNFNSETPLTTQLLFSYDLVSAKSREMHNNFEFTFSGDYGCATMRAMWTVMGAFAPMYMHTVNMIMTHHSYILLIMNLLYTNVV